MADSGKAETLRRNLLAHPEILSLGEIEVEDNNIKHISLESRALGGVTIRQLDVADAPGLFEFYTQGLSEKPRRLFAPYPLFHTPPSSADDLVARISNWKSEKDWTALILVKDGRTIGFALLKRFSTEQATSAIAVRDGFLKIKLGYILQSMIVEQARLLCLKEFHVKIISDNLASILLHEKCGFRQTRLLSSDIYEEMFQYLSDCDKKSGKKAVKRQLVEMVIDLKETKHHN